jgi:hypothetical protein
MNFHVSRHFLIAVFIILAIVGAIYYFFARSASFYKLSTERLSQLDSYLSENFSFTLNLDKKTEASIKVFCDQTVDTSLNDKVGVTYPCQNQNPAHKIVIGVASGNISYTSVLKSIGNEQLFWINNATNTKQEGVMSCNKRDDYQVYRNVVLGVECETVSAQKETRYASIVFLKPAYNEKRKIFIAVLNTSKIDSRGNVDSDLLALLKKKRIVAKESISDIFSFLVNSFFEIEDVAVTNTLSTEALRTEGSNSSSFVTRDSGNDIDTTVCNVANSNSCYPIYCSSSSGVWNSSLNKCVEPSVPKIAEKGESLCPKESPIWDGTKCLAFAGNIISSSVCTIVENNNSCDMKITWSVNAPRKKIEVRMAGAESTVLASNASGTLSYTFPYQSVPYILELYEGDKKLSDGKFTTECATGGWDNLAKKCVDPFIKNISLSGEYYTTSGSIIFECNNATNYLVRNSEYGTVVSSSSYSHEASTSVSTSGNYSIMCSHGDYLGLPKTIFYHAPPPPPPKTFLKVSSQSVNGTGTTTLSWEVIFPVESCSLSAKIFCKESECGPSQIESEKNLNGILQSGNTDDDDPEGSRSMHIALAVLSKENTNNGWNTTGKKTVSITNSTEFTLSCGNGIESKQRVYTGKKQVSQEQ